VLRPGGILTGRVTDRTGRPIENVCVILTGRQRLTDYSPMGYGQIPVTNRNGAYRITGLPAGRYWVWFDPAWLCGAKAGRPPAWHRGSVTVLAGRVTRKVDGRLGALGDGSISGRVTTAGTARGVRGTCITASFLSATHGAPPPPAGSPPGPQAVTGHGGRFTFTHLPSGRYLLIVRQCAGGGPFAPAERRVQLGTRHRRAGVVIALQRGATITGTVRAVGGAAAGICAEPIPVRSPDGGVAVTGLDGSYAITGLVAGKYRVLFTPDCAAGAAPAAPAWYGGSAPSVITVRPGGTWAGVDGALTADGGISGKVTGPGSRPLAGVCVTAVPASAAVSLGGAVTSITTAGGGYGIGELVPGKYRVEFRSGCGASGWKTQWWRGIVTVTPGTVTSGIDAAMVR
jgi:hypothetical protein